MIRISARNGPFNGSPAAWRPLRIAMIGQKGLPAMSGGVEHHIEALGQRLAARGHSVTVFHRSSYGSIPESPYLGMQVRAAPTIASKHLDAIVHSATSTLLALKASSDIVHYHALGPGLLAPLPRYASDSAVVLTVHGLDFERSKWSLPAQSILALAHQMSARVPNETVVVSRTLQAHYYNRFDKHVEYITNGVTLPEPAPVDALKDFGVQPGRYILFVGRLVPEKVPHAVVQAYRSIDSPLKLVVAGDSSFTNPYVQQLRDLAGPDERIVFPGFVGGTRLRALYEHCRLFVQPSVVEGLPLTLLEALSYSIPVLASDIEPHVEVIGHPAPGRDLFRAGDLTSLTDTLRRVLDRPPTDRKELQEFRDQMLKEYDWDRATDQLEHVYLRVLTGRRRQRARARAPLGYAEEAIQSMPEPDVPFSAN